MEVAIAKVYREGGAHVRDNHSLRDLNIAVSPVIANGLPFWGGKQLAIDTTVISTLTGAGVARGRRPGIALQEAKRNKEARYHEIVASERCRLVVFGFEVAGR